LGFGFLAEGVPPERPADRLAWEEQVLGLPVSVHPLAARAQESTALTVSRFLAQQPSAPAPARGALATVTGARLPGWTGGAGFFLSDERSYLTAVGPRGQRPPPIWQPVEVVGRWYIDEWGSAALQYETVRVL
jgi:hypothetical protein